MRPIGSTSAFQRLTSAAPRQSPSRLWANRTYSTSGGHTLFEDSTNYSSSTTGFAFFPDDNTCNGIRAALRGNVGNVGNCYSQPSSGVWHHLAVVFDKSQTGGDEVKFYVDGVLQTVNRSLNSSTNTNNFGNNPIYLYSRAGNNQFTSGTIDDLRIYNSALTAEEIQEIYNNPGLVSIAVTPANPSIAVGKQQQFTATGTYSDGSKKDLTSSANWTSSAPSVATISSGGLATGVAAGTTTIQAALATVHGSTGLTVTAPPSFTISASPSSLSVAQGNQGTSTITTAISGGFNSAISLSTSGVPSGITVSFSTNPIPAPGSGNSIMTITVGASTPTGTYPITVTGNGGGIQQTATVTLTVTAASNFTISASPSSLSVAQGNQGTSTITTAVSGGFNSAISLSTSGVPSGTTVSFSSNPIPAPGSGNSIMTITVGASTPVGTYPITVTGNGGGIQQQVTITLTVTAQVALSWTASSSPGIAGYNAYRSTNSNGPYTKLNASLISTTSYNDQAVQSGNTYYYVTTAVDSQGDESAYSNQASATVP